jgi:hypothetical protein
VYAQTVVHPFAHNPTIRPLPNGTGFVIFFIGDGTGTPAQCNGSRVPQEPLRGAAGSEAKNLTGGSVHVVFASSVLGPWSPPVAVEFNDSTGAGASWTGGGTNPSPLIHPDGSVTLALQRGFAASPGKELLGVAHAAAGWRGPYTMITPVPVQPERPGCIAGTGEDPFLWENRRGMHIIYHGMCPTGLLEAHHAFSADRGVSWTVSPRQTYGYAARFTDGTTRLFARVERPQLTFAPGGDQAVVLFNGVCNTGSLDQIYECLELKPVPPSKTPVLVMTWTLARPLKRAHRQTAPSLSLV